ncbi:PREDICTED: uncharacterized protein LOC106811893 isoform X2 [Priapulus caudatus]|uniref:Uncharacterized protein LOC106811893 isoform X2 n=1 Tax=Priapulus caudatus TaxID=37621 RepID=A0ABM1EFZ8_PRICU|nr:PREDICTED: uncharacterized protein LOC106811893 isoform X2 [Priapulus caudatus]
MAGTPGEQSACMSAGLEQLQQLASSMRHMTESFTYAIETFANIQGCGQATGSHNSREHGEGVQQGGGHGSVQQGGGHGSVQQGGGHVSVQQGGGHGSVQQVRPLATRGHVTATTVNRAERHDVLDPKSPPLTEGPIVTSAVSIAGVDREATRLIWPQDVGQVQGAENSSSAGSANSCTTRKRLLTLTGTTRLSHQASIPSPPSGPYRSDTGAALRDNAQTLDTAGLDGTISLCGKHASQHYGAPTDDVTEIIDEASLAVAVTHSSGSGQQEEWRSQMGKDDSQVLQLKTFELPVKRRKQAFTKDHVKEVLVFPPFDNITYVGISIPRGDTRERLAHRGLVSRMTIHWSWTSHKIKQEITALFRKQFGLAEGELLPYTYLRTLPGTKRLCQPDVPPTLEWNAREVLTAAGQGALYIMSHIHPAENVIDLTQEDANTAALHVKDVAKIDTAMVFSEVADRVIQSLEHTTATSNTFVMCEYGAADGLVSGKLMQTATELLYSKGFQVQLVYQEDRRCMRHRLVDTTQFLQRRSQALVLMSGASFYGEVMPRCSVDFAFSFASLHRLSERNSLPKSRLRNGMSDVMTCEDKQQASTDWETVLLKRAAELKCGTLQIIAVLISY